MTDAVNQTGGWSEFLSSEENRAGLLQFGLSMLGGSSGSLSSDLAQGIGQGFEARDRSLVDQRNVAASEAEAARTARKDAVGEANVASQIAARGQNAASNAKRAKAAETRAAKALGKGDDKSLRKDWLKFVDDSRGVDGSLGDLTQLRAQWEALTGKAAPGADSAVTAATPTTPAAPVQIETQEQFDSLPIGSQFILNGQTYIKK